MREFLEGAVVMLLLVALYWIPGWIMKMIKDIWG